MLQNKHGLEKKYETIENLFKNKENFTVSDVQEALGNKRSTVYWILSNLAKKGYIYPTGKGIYSLQKKEKEIKSSISSLASLVINILKESGNEFFISGLDILSVFMEHVPETYPVILFVNKYSADEIYDVLSKNNIDAVTNRYFKNYHEIRRFSSVKEIVLIKETNEFVYSKNNLAVFEKAFVDLFYEVTRNDYPLSLQELVRIYLNMKRRISIDTARMKKIASRRNIQEDIRYITEYNHINQKAREFADILKKQELK